MNKDIKKNIKIEDVYYNIYFFFFKFGNVWRFRDFFLCNIIFLYGNKIIRFFKWCFSWGILCYFVIRVFWSVFNGVIIDYFVFFKMV